MGKNRFKTIQVHFGNMGFSKKIISIVARNCIIRENYSLGYHDLQIIKHVLKCSINFNFQALY